MAFPAVQEKEEVREGEAEMKKAKKAKGKKKKDTEIEKGPVGSEGVTKANRSSMPSLDAADFKADGAACTCKGQVNKSRSQMKSGKFAKGTKGKRAAMPEKPPTGNDVPPSKKKRDSVWADGFEVNDAAFVLTEGADKLATEKYAREKRKRNAQGQPHNMIYANTFNT